MPKFNKPTPEKLNTIWAVNAVSGDVVEIDTNKIQQGWVQEKPPYEYENWINQQHDQYVAYINQLGIPEWDQYTEYQNGKSYVQGSNNVIYKCIQTHINKNPATAGNEAFWERFEGNRQATTTTRGTTEFATPPEVNSAVPNLAVTPESLLLGFASTGNLVPSKGHLKIPLEVSGQRRNFIVQWGTITGLSNTSFSTTPLDVPFTTSFLGAVVTHPGS